MWHGSPEFIRLEAKVTTSFVRMNGSCYRYHRCAVQAVRWTLPWPIMRLGSYNSITGPHRWHCQPSRPLSDSASTRSTLPAPSTTSVGEKLSNTKCIVVALHLNMRLVGCILLAPLDPY